jgi:serine/threonine protein kinase
MAASRQCGKLKLLGVGSYEGWRPRPPRCCAADQHGFPRGSVIYFGKYELLSRINIGGMAEIVKARDTSLPHEQLVAIKRILPHLCDDQQYRAMFLDESRVLAQLQHPSVIEAFEIGEIDDTPYIALEYVYGQDARALFHETRRAEQRIPIAIACYVIARVCEGLHHAHEQTDAHGQSLGIVHRDVSLQNILLSYNGDVKLTDFGIVVSAENVARTDMGVVKGKFGYMSPEQINGAALDRRSDVFAVGICLYELLTGERLFSGENDYKAVERVRNVDFEPPSALNRQIPSRLERIVMKALAKHPRERYESTNDLRRALQSFMAEANEFVSSDDLGAYMRDTFANELAGQAAPLAQHGDHVTAAQPAAAEITGLHAFDDLDPVGAIDVAPLAARRPSAAQQSSAEEITVVGPQPDGMPLYPELEIVEPPARGTLRPPGMQTRPVPSVPPLVPRANSIPASAVGRRSVAASLLDVGPPVQRFDMEWDENEPTTVSQGLQDAPQLYAAPVAEPIRPLRSERSEPMPTALQTGPTPTDVGYSRSTPTLEIPKPFTFTPLLIASVLAVVAVALLVYLLRDRGVSTLRLETDPVDAVVSVDGQRAVGVVSPFVISGLAAGVNHSIAVEKPGYVSWSTKLRVRPDKTFELPLVKLERVAEPPPVPAVDPVPAALNPASRSAPVHAPQSNSPKPEGARARREPPPERRVERAPARPVRKPEPKAAPAAASSAKGGMGTLRINTRPWSQVKVDGRLVGNTPQMNLQLTAGSHTVTLTNPDFGVSKTVSIDIKADSIVTRVLTLVP